MTDTVIGTVDFRYRVMRDWGEGLFSRPHGLHIGPDDTLYCTDDGDQTMRARTLDGKVLMTLGIPGEPTPYMAGAPGIRSRSQISPTLDHSLSSGKQVVEERHGDPVRTEL